jgi:hypothetical protein
LTQIVPFEMVDAVLAECGAVQRRLRKLPARVVVYLLLAAALFEECGYPAVWAKLTSALGSLPIPKVTATALWHARARLGVRPLRALFDLVRGPASAIRTAGVRWAGLLVVAIDGTSGASALELRALAIWLTLPPAQPSWRRTPNSAVRTSRSVAMAAAVRDWSRAAARAE